MSGWIYQPDGGAGDGALSAGMSTLGNTAGTTGLGASQLVLAGINNITLSQSINGVSATVSVSGADLVTTTPGLSAGMSTLGNTAGTTGLVASRLVLVGGANVTLSQSVNGASATVTVSAPDPVTTTPGLSAGMSTLGNTAGTTGLVASRLVLAGGNGVTISQSVNGASATATISVSTYSPAISFSGGVSTGGNTAGTTGIVASQLVLVGGNNVTLSQSANGGSATVTISAAAGGGGGLSAGMSTDGNSAGTTGLVASQLVLVGGANITLSQSVNGASATLTVSAAAPGGGGVTLSHWPPIPAAAVAQSLNVGTFGNSSTTVSFFVCPCALPAAVSLNAVMVQVSHATVAGTGSATHGLMAGLYSLNGSTMSLVSSFVFNLRASQNSVTAQSIRWWFGTDSAANSTSNSGNISASFTANRWVPIYGSDTSIAASQYYWAFGFTRSTVGANVWPMSAMIHSAASSLVVSRLGSASARPLMPFAGTATYRFTTNTGTAFTAFALPTTFNTSIITRATGAVVAAQSIPNLAVTQ